MASDVERPAVGYSAPTLKASFLRVEGDRVNHADALIAAEVPVALVYNGKPYAVMMCTPADLEDFAVGFTVSEGLAGAVDIRRAEVVRYSAGIELQIELPASAAERLAERSRAMTGRTGCGLCGVELIDEAIREPRAVRSSATFGRAAIWRAGEALGAAQALNNQTNAIHAAAWADRDGNLRVVREDVGRHNALDKVLGALVRSGEDASAGFAVVTSRASYELVQKIAAANIPLLAAVSRPTALAVHLADNAGITLLGLLRGHTANVYTHPSRLT